MPIGSAASTVAPAPIQAFVPSSTLPHNVAPGPTSVPSARTTVVSLRLGVRLRWRRSSSRLRTWRLASQVSVSASLSRLREVAAAPADGGSPTLTPYSFVGTDYFRLLQIPIAYGVLRLARSSGP